MPINYSLQSPAELLNSQIVKSNLPTKVPTLQLPNPDHVCKQLKCCQEKQKSHNSKTACDLPTIDMRVASKSSKPKHSGNQILHSQNRQNHMVPARDTIEMWDKGTAMQKCVHFKEPCCLNRPAIVRKEVIGKTDQHAHSAVPKDCNNNDNNNQEQP